MYALTCTLNLNQLLDEKARVTNSVIAGVKLGFTGDTISLVLVSFIAAGYLLIVVYASITDAPMLVDMMRVDLKLAKQKKKIFPDDYRDVTAFYGLAFALLLYLIFVTVFSVYNTLDAWVGYLSFGFLPWFLLCCRGYFAIPDSEIIIKFCRAVDAVVNIPDLRTALTMMCLAVGGLFWKNWFTVMLLDIFNLSKVLGLIAHVIELQAKSLGLTFYIIFVASYIYTAFGYSYFEGTFYYDDQIVTQTMIEASRDDDLVDDGDITTCETLLQCFWMVLYKAMPAGDMGAVVDAMDRTDPAFLGRVW